MEDDEEYDYEYESDNGFEGFTSGVAKAPSPAAASSVVESGNWTCPVCTFVNDRVRVDCEACLSGKDGTKPPELDLYPWRCPSCNENNVGTNVKCVFCNKRRNPKSGSRSEPPASAPTAASASALPLSLAPLLAAARPVVSPPAPLRGSLTSLSPPGSNRPGQLIVAAQPAVPSERGSSSFTFEGGRGDRSDSSSSDDDDGGMHAAWVNAFLSRHVETTSNRTCLCKKCGKILSNLNLMRVHVWKDHKASNGNSADQSLKSDIALIEQLADTYDDAAVFTGTSSSSSSAAEPLWKDEAIAHLLSLGLEVTAAEERFAAAVAAKRRLVTLASTAAKSSLAQRSSSLSLANLEPPPQRKSKARSDQKETRPKGSNSKASSGRGISGSDRGGGRRERKRRRRRHSDSESSDDFSDEDDDDEYNDDEGVDSDDDDDGDDEDEIDIEAPSDDEDDEDGDDNEGSGNYSDRSWGGDAGGGADDDDVVALSDDDYDDRRAGGKKRGRGGSQKEPGNKRQQQRDAELEVEGFEPPPAPSHVMTESELRALRVARLDALVGQTNRLMQRLSGMLSSQRTAMEAEQRAQEAMLAAKASAAAQSEETEGNADAVASPNESAGSAAAASVASPPPPPPISSLLALSPSLRRASSPPAPALSSSSSSSSHSAATSASAIAQPRLIVGTTLRSYQLSGLQWLVSLYDAQLNGILADVSASLINQVQQPIYGASSVFTRNMQNHVYLITFIALYSCCRRWAWARRCRSSRSLHT